MALTLNVRNQEQKYKIYVITIEKIEIVERAISDFAENISLVHDVVATQLIKTSEKENKIEKAYSPRLDHLTSKKKSRYIYLNKKFHKKISKCKFTDLQTFIYTGKFQWLGIQILEYDL